ncbi:MAG: hypothetical protein QN198_12435, partial [Armatimonadota bacterium]|nr:hypothetical protein [Armatimonadota bacterium]
FDDQLREYPKDVVEVHRKAAEFYTQLLSDFGEAVRPIAVGFTTFRGLWLALRYRLGPGLSVVINWKKVLPDLESYEPLFTAVREELS